MTDENSRQNTSLVHGTSHLSSERDVGGSYWLVQTVSSIIQGSLVGPRLLKYTGLGEGRFISQRRRTSREADFRSGASSMHSPLSSRTKHSVCDRPAEAKRAQAAILSSHRCNTLPFRIHCVLNLCTTTILGWHLESSGALGRAQE